MKETAIENHKVRVYKFLVKLQNRVLMNKTLTNFSFKNVVILVLFNLLVPPLVELIDSVT